MIAAIYARKSTEQRDRDEADKSVNHQEVRARTYIRSKGWTVAEDYIYKDDAVSGAEFSRRPHFVRLLRDVERKPRPPFDVLVMADESRLGRETIETSYALQQIIQTGVRVFFYLDDRERILDSPMDKITLALTTFADELKRVKDGQTTYDKVAAKAAHGYVVGGTAFGYDNFAVDGATGKKSHVERRKNEEQAAIVREIFERYVSGWGYRRITLELNARPDIPSPRETEEGKPAGWSPSSVRAILRRELYRGVVVWNQSKKRDKFGRQNQKARPETEWMRLPVNEDLRIVSDELWQAAQDRMARTRTTVPTAKGARPMVRRDIVGARYLLSGFARCGVCGWSMTVVTRSHGEKRKAFLACLSHYKRGPHVCPNAQIVPLARADEAVLAALKADALDPAVVSTIVNMVFERLAPSNIDAKLKALHSELHDIEGFIANLARAIERAADLDPLIAQMRERQDQRARLQQEMTSAQALRQVQLDQTRIEEEVQAAVSNWRQTLATAAVEGGRALLREVLSGPLVFTPTAEGYTFRGPVILGELIAGAVNEGVQQAGAHKVASLMPASWNRIASWLQQIDGLRQAA